MIRPASIIITVPIPYERLYCSAVDLSHPGDYRKEGIIHESRLPSNTALYTVRPIRPSRMTYDYRNGHSKSFESPDSIIERVSEWPLCDCVRRPPSVQWATAGEYRIGHRDVISLWL